MFKLIIYKLTISICHTCLPFAFTCYWKIACFTAVNALRIYGGRHIPRELELKNIVDYDKLLFNFIVSDDDLTVKPITLPEDDQHIDEKSCIEPKSRLSQVGSFILGASCGILVAILVDSIFNSNFPFPPPPPGSGGIIPPPPSHFGVGIGRGIR